MTEPIRDPQREDALRELFELHFLDEDQLQAELMHIQEPEPEAKGRLTKPGVIHHDLAGEAEGPPHQRRARPVVVPSTFTLSA